MASGCHEEAGTRQGPRSARPQALTWGLSPAGPARGARRPRRGCRPAGAGVGTERRAAQAVELVTDDRGAGGVLGVARVESTPAAGATYGSCRGWPTGPPWGRTLHEVRRGGADDRPRGRRSGRPCRPCRPPRERFCLATAAPVSTILAPDAAGGGLLPHGYSLLAGRGARGGSGGQGGGDARQQVLDDLVARRVDLGHQGLDGGVHLGSRQLHAVLEVRLGPSRAALTCGWASSLAAWPRALPARGSVRPCRAAARRGPRRQLARPAAAVRVPGQGPSRCWSCSCCGTRVLLAMMGKSDPYPSCTVPHARGSTAPHTGAMAGFRGRRPTVAG